MFFFLLKEIHVHFFAKEVQENKGGSQRGSLMITCVALHNHLVIVC